MKFKSTMALLIALVMVMTAFVSGCGNKNADSTSGSTVSTQDTQKDKKEIEISVAFWDFQEFGNDEIGKKIADDLKIKIKTMPLSWDNDMEQVKLFGASGNMPDIFATYTVDTDPTRFYTWLDQGLTRTVPDELVNKYPTVKSIFEKDPVVNAVKTIKGAYTYIPRPGSLKNYYKASQQVVYYRKDWMANVGIAQAPQTMDEFYTMLKAFTFNDPNKNGKADTYGLTTAGLNPTMFSIWGLDMDSWVKENGKLIPAYFSQKAVEPLKYFRKLYDEKIYDPEFAKNGYKQAIQKITTNTFGVLARNGDLHWINKTIVGNWAAANTDVADPLTVWGVLDPLKKDANTDPSWQQFVDAGGTEISSKVDDEKLDRILEMYEYLMKPEVRTMLMYGIEGVDYKIVDGKMEKTIDPATNEPVNVNSKYPSTMMACLTDWYWDNDIDSPYTDFTQPIKDLAKSVRDKANAVALKDDLLPVRYISTPAKDTTNIVWLDAYTQIVMGKEDVQAMFDKFVKESMDKGMATAIDEVNAKAAELGIK
jgi:putative aldouronate transport system substrate-binding protein